MAQSSGRTMPFGYDFRQEFSNIPPQPPPSGPPLLTAEQGDMMANFFENPNLNFNPNDFTTMAFSSNADMPVWPELFGEQEGMLATHYNMSSMSSPAEFRPQSRQDQAITHPRQSSLHAQQAREYDEVQTGAAQQHDGDNHIVDEGHLGASALVNLLHHARGSVAPRRQSDFTFPHHSSSNTFNQHVLSAQQYTPATNAAFHNTHMPTHAGTTSSFVPPTGYQRTGALTSHGSVGHSIPASLQFNTDMNFTHPSRGNQFGYLAANSLPTDDQRAFERMTYNNDYAPLQPSVNPRTNGQPSEMAPPQRTNGNQARPAIQRTNTVDTISEPKEDQATKRRRTQSVPQIAAASAALAVKTPIKQEFDSPHRVSSRSTTSASQSASPRPDKSSKSSLKRRSSAAAAATPGPTSSAKRAKLSDAQRKENHIQSEKRRRAEMKGGYDQLDKLVPSLKAGTLSKAQVLQHTVVFLEALLSGNDIAEKRLAELEAKAGAQNKRTSTG